MIFNKGLKMKNGNRYIFVLMLLFTINITAQSFYDVNTINTIELVFEESNWDYLLDVLVAEGNEERLMGKMIINGITYDSVGVRYKGNSSYNANQVKNPLNIKLDYVINNQDHEGYETIKLANVFKDPTFIREVFGYEMLRNYLPSSLANYAKVYVNGTYLGLYTNVQDVDKGFLKTNFYSNDYPFFKGELNTGETPTLVKVWSYFGEDSSNYSNYYEIESDFGWKELINFLNILNNNNASVSEVLNIDRHLWMLAFDILNVNLDSPVNFAHNYYLYQDDAGRFNPIIWDLNENFGVFTMLLDGAPLSVTGMQQLDPFLNLNNSNYPIISKILSNATYKKMYVAHMKTIIKDYFSNDLYRTRALEIQNIIDSEVQNDPNKFFTYTQFQDNIDVSVGGSVPPIPGSQSVVGITELMENRITFLNSKAEFAATAPEISNISNKLISNKGWIIANVSNATSVKLASRDNILKAFQKIEMYDDGNHNDESANDGIFGVSIDVGTSGIQYYIYAENNNAASFSPEKAENEFYSFQNYAEIVINEFMASNSNTITDNDGEYEDWIELFNNTDKDISLLGYYLSDDGNELTKWNFPDTSISAGGLLTIWADDDGNQSGLHSNFKLSASGEVIYLVDSDTNIVDEITFGEQETDLSTGRFPNGTGAFAIMNPSFSTLNTSGISDVEENNLQNSVNEFALEQNYPNPFNPNTVIKYSIPESGFVTLKVFNILGQEVAKLVNEVKSEGSYQVAFNASNLASGLYLYKIQSGNFSSVKKMLLLR